MNYFTQTTPAPSTQTPSVSPATVQPKSLKLSEEEEKKHLANSLFLTNGYHQKYRGRVQPIPHFPTPDQAAKLNKVYTMIQTYERTQILSVSGIATQGAYFFDYNSINHSGSLTAVFDQYRIAMVEITFLPDATQSPFGVTAPCMFASCVDKDDVTSISMAQIGDYPGAKVTLAVKEHKHVFVPTAALAAYSGAFTSYAIVEAPWIDVASPSVQHYGVKYAFGVATPVAGYEVRVRLMLQLRQTDILGQPIGGYTEPGILEYGKRRD